MLQNIRKGSQGPVAKVIVYGIVFTMALFGFESIVGGFGDGDAVAKVNGEPILQQEFERRVEVQRNRVLSQLGEQADPALLDESAIRQQVLDAMIERETIAQDVDNKSLYMSDSAIDQYIYGMDAFQENGSFSNERLQYLLRTNGLTLAGFREQLRQDFVVSQPQSALLASAFIADLEQKEMIELDRQERTFSTVTFARSDFVDDVDVSEDEIKKYYETNASEFMTEEAVDVSYILIDRNDFLEDSTVSEEAIQRLYENETADYEATEERDGSHILVSINDDRDEVAALALANDISARLAQGESFEDLAKEFSDDPGSAANGGGLGAAGKGVYVDAFEEKLFSLNEGDVSEPVKTQFGFHIIRLNEVLLDEAPAFEELKASLEARLKNEQAIDRYAQLSEEIADITYSTPDLAGPAEELSMDVLQIKDINASTDNEFFSLPRVQALLFSEEFRAEDANSEFIEVAEGRGLVFHIDEYREAKKKPLANVRDQIVEALQNSKASDLAEAKGKEILAGLASGEEQELEWEQKENIKRNDFSVDRQTNKKAYSIKDADTIEGFQRDNGDFILVRLENISQGEDTLLPEERRQIAQVMSQRIGATDFQAYSNYLSRTALIEQED